jgi:thiamine biosynthesis lipoprotein
MARFAGAARSAGSLSRGLVDATLLRQIEDAGYRADLPDSLPLAAALRFAPPRRPARPAGRAAWRRLEVDIEGATVTRPPGIALDSGGVAKGLLADVLAEQLAGHDAFAINCAGDLAIGGRAAMTRQVQVESPFDGRTVHAFELQRGAVATSGIGRRSWLGADGRPAHHLLDPATGRPAFTGIVQATALAPSALEAEVRAKAALLSGPLRAAGWLAGGGVLVFDDGSHTVIQPPPVVTLSELSSFARRRADAVPEAA